MVTDLYQGFMMGKSDIDIFQEHSEFDSKEGFGLRLATLRKAKGFTQVELAKAIGVTQRVITYYERETKRPPAHLLDKICKALEISADEFYGLSARDEDFQPETDAKNKNLWKKLRLAANLPQADQKALIRILEGLLAKNGGC